MIRKHWQEHFDPDAPLVFTRRRKLGLPGKLWVEAGDPLTPEMIEQLGKHRETRVKRWFEAGILRMENWKSARTIRQEADASTEPIERPEPEPSGRGWYTCRLPNGKTKKARGLAAANALLDEAYATSEVGGQ